MNYLGIDFNVINRPGLDKDFIPFGRWLQAYLRDADRPVTIALERENGLVSIRRSFIRGREYDEANYRCIERLIKFLLWSVGGWRVYISGCGQYADRLRAAYRRGGERDFDAGFVSDVYGRELELCFCAEADIPPENEQPKAIGGHMEGCRIGFDAGGSDRKVSAVMDGETVYSEEVVWYPKLETDPDYHYREIVAAFKTAASKLPRVDAIGISSAGVYVDNCPMIASLFIKVPREQRSKVKSIYKRAAAEIGDVPLVVANDGDVTALAGAMSLGTGAILGIAMGTSEAVGYVDRERRILGWLNELAFAPVDLNPSAMVDEWSGDRGVGCKYFSQDAVIKLAPAAGIELDAAQSPAQRLKAVQALANAGDEKALEIFRSIGVYLAHAAALYAGFYDVERMMILGRVASGVGGDLVVSECRRVLDAEYPELASRLKVELPDERMRRVGQSVAAASLPEL